LPCLVSDYAVGLEMVKLLIAEHCAVGAGAKVRVRAPGAAAAAAAYQKKLRGAHRFTAAAEGEEGEGKRIGLGMRFFAALRMTLVALVTLNFVLSLIKFFALVTLNEVKSLIRFFAALRMTIIKNRR